MKINPKLNLNKTPSAVENGSLVIAKNIKISSDGQYITQEEGLEAIVDFSANEGEKIVGVIPCNTELVVFTHKGLPYVDDNTSDPDYQSPITNGAFVLDVDPSKVTLKQISDNTRFYINPNDKLIVEDGDFINSDGTIIFKRGEFGVAIFGQFWNNFYSKIFEGLKQVDNYLGVVSNDSKELLWIIYNFSNPVKYYICTVTEDTAATLTLSTDYTTHASVALVDYYNNNESIGTFYPLSLKASIYISESGTIETPVESIIPESSIYRYDESTKVLTKVPTGWKWRGGEINGDYTYNVNQELIIGFGEGKTTTDVPFKTINLDTSKSTDSDNWYNGAPQLPKFNMLFKGFRQGVRMASGTYHFFIRFEISNETYTSWYKLGTPLISATVSKKNIISHNYVKVSGQIFPSYNTYVYDFVNSGESTNNNFVLNINLLDTNNFLNYQIGYVVQHDNATTSRLWRKFSINSNEQNDTIIFDASNPLSYSIDEMLITAFNLYNVGIVHNYENRLYVADFKETQSNIDLSSYADTIVPNYILSDFDVDTGGSTGDTKGTAILTKGTYSETLTIYNYGIGTYYIKFTDLLVWFKRIDNYNFGSIADLSTLYVSHILWKYGGHIEYGRTTANNLILVIGLDKSVSVHTMVGTISRTVASADQSNPLIVHLYDNETAKYKINLIDVTNLKVTSVSPTETIEPVSGTFNYNIYNNRTLIPNQVYNFFVHYVRSDGTFTNGIRLSNNVNTQFTFGTTNIHGDTIFNTAINNYPSITTVNFTRLKTVSQLKSYKICTLFNNANNGKFGYFKNAEGDIMFRAPHIGNRPKARITVKFSNIKIPSGYVGVFFSYERVDPIVAFTGLVVNRSMKTISNEVILEDKNYEGTLLIASYQIKHSGFIESNNGFAAQVTASDFYNIDANANRNYISNIQLRNSNDALVGNGGREHTIYLTTTATNEYSTVEDITTVAQILILKEHLYSSKDKQLISYGFVLYGNNTDYFIYDETVYGAAFAYDAFISYDSAFTYINGGVNIAEDNVVTVHNGNEIQSNNYATVLPYYKYTSTPEFLKTFNIEPEILVWKWSELNTYTNKIIRPSNQSDLYKLRTDYIINDPKILINVNMDRLEDLRYQKMIRRSNVMQSESLENAWRRFDPNAYKVVVENKGNITNIIGIGLYLMFHTEHSLFMFNRENQLTTEETVAQLNIPDPFDISYREITSSSKGYSGLQDKKAWAVNEFGYFFYDNDGRHLYNFDSKEFQLLDLDLSEFIQNHEIDKVRIGYDYNNKRMLFSMSVDGEPVTLSYNVYTKNWISLHDYAFNRAYNTKIIPYYLNKDSNKLFTYAKANYSNFKELGITNILYPVYISDNIHAAYFDIICNFNYELFKTLESISYICSEVIDFKSPVEGESAESTLNRMYSGDNLLIYTDNCRTNLLDINIDNYHAHKHCAPFYDRGVWNFNCFRNNIIPINKSNHLSLIYGKYIVARFVILSTGDKPVKFENVTFYVSSQMNV